MGAIIIGLGVAVAAIGIVLGAIGYGSPETTFGAALITVGGIGVVGGLVLFALGSIQRALVVIAQKLDGVLHFEPDEDVEPNEQPRALDIASDDYPPLPTSYREAGIDLSVPTPAPAPARPSMIEKTTPVEPPAAKQETSGGLPGWFRRKRETEEVVAEPEALEPDFEEPVLRPLAPEPRRTEVRNEMPRLDPRPEAPRPEAPRRDGLSFGRDDTFQREPAPSAPIAPPVRERPAPTFGEDPFEPRPRVRDDFGLEPGAPPAFLRESDLLGDLTEEEPAEPEVTVLKAGTIGGMAYKLYSDGSIEADLPDGTLRFASLGDLRDHVANSAAGKAED